MGKSPNPGRKSRIELSKKFEIKKWVIKFFSIQCCGSGSKIRCLFDAWIRDGKIRIQDKHPESAVLVEIACFIGHYEKKIAYGTTLIFNYLTKKTMRILLIR